MHHKSDEDRLQKQGHTREINREERLWFGKQTKEDIQLLIKGSVKN